MTVKSTFTEYRDVEIPRPDGHDMLVRNLCAALDKLPNGAAIRVLTLRAHGGVFIKIQTDAGDLDG